MSEHHEEEVLGKAYDGRLMKRLLAYLRPYSSLVALALVAILLHSFLAAAGPFLAKVAIDKYMMRTAGGGLFLDRWLSTNPVLGITQVGVLYLCALLLSFAVDFLQTYAMQLAGQKVMFDLRMQIFGHLQKLHVGFFDRNPVGRLVTRLTSDVDALNELFTSGVVAVFGDFFTLGFIVFVMLKLNAPLALVSFAVLPLIALVTVLFRGAVRDSYRRVRAAIARINSYLQEHITGMPVVQLFNHEERSFREFDAVNRRHLIAFKDSVLAHSLFYPSIEILSAAAIAAILWYGGLKVLGGGLTVGVVVAFIQYAQRFYRPIQDLSEKYNILQGAMASAERVFKLLDTRVEVASPAAPVALEQPRGRIEFRNVWFAYGRSPESSVPGASRRGDERVPGPAGEKGPQPGEALGADGHCSGDGGAADGFEWVLKDVSFTVEPGETVAIVGHTGAGKTTIISLLLRFYDVQRGQILLDGADLRDLDLGGLRRLLGVVLQDPFLFSGTIERNIRLGTENLDEDDVLQAAEQVNLADFIRTLPNGMREEMRERGSTLSTGQKQLISFARALAHKPRILILDEATSSVDTETELRVREALGRLVEGRTSIIIAHRLSTIQRADRILVMHKGQLRESGTHQELLARRGIYWKLYQLQYKDQELRERLASTGGLATDAHGPL